MAHEVTRNYLRPARRFHLPHEELAALVGLEGREVTELNIERSGVYFTVMTQENDEQA